MCNDSICTIALISFLPGLDVTVIARLAAYRDQQGALDKLRRLLG